MELRHVESRQPEIGIWGPTDAGKTTYLAGLLLAIDKLAPMWTVWPAEGDVDAEEFLEKCVGDMAKGTFPSATEVGKPTMYSFRMWRRGSFLGRNERYHELAVIDAAGALILDPKDRSGYFEILRQCKGILCMVDPGSSQVQGVQGSDPESQSYFKLLSRLATNLAREDGLSEDGKLNINLAFCLTKMDLEEHWSLRKQPEEYLRQVLGQQTYDFIINRCARKRVKFFSVSVAGRCLTPEGNSCSNYVQSGNKKMIGDMEQWRPYRPLDPLFWLFDRLEEDSDATLPWSRRILRRLWRAPNYREPKL